LLLQQLGRRAGRDVAVHGGVAELDVVARKFDVVSLQLGITFY
jgi:hypothetical protein